MSQLSSTVVGAPGGPCCIEFPPRQRELVALSAEGLRDNELASRLGVSTRTIRTHLERLYDKYGIHSRGAAVALFFLVLLVVFRFCAQRPPATPELLASLIGEE